MTMVAHLSILQIALVLLAISALAVFEAHLGDHRHGGARATTRELGSPSEAIQKQRGGGSHILV